MARETDVEKIYTNKTRMFQGVIALMKHTKGRARGSEPLFWVKGAGKAALRRWCLSPDRSEGIE